MSELEKIVGAAVDQALAESRAVHDQHLRVLGDDMRSLQGQLLAFTLVAEALARTAPESERTSAAALLDIAAERWPASPEGLAGFEAAHEKLRAALLRT